MRVLRMIAILLLSLAATGCVERRLRVESEPEGAELYVDGAFQGNTPVDLPFTFYGTRELRLEKEGYQTLVLLQKVSPPAYEWIPLDFVSENLTPVTFHDDHLVRIELSPRQPFSLEQKDQLIDELHERARQRKALLDENPAK